MRKASLIVISGMLLAFQFTSCGNDNNGNNPNTGVLDISPAGPTMVKRSSTLQFTANQAVTWSVAGGDANGTINAEGLYTSPETLPLSLDQVSIIAENANGNSVEAFVDLKAADTLAFAAPVQVNSDPISALAVLGSLFTSPVNDRLAVAQHALEINSVWSINDNNPTCAFSQNIGLAGFSPELTITDANESRFPLAIAVDSQDNPVIMSLGLTSNRISFFSSSDGGATFNAPTPVSIANPTFNQQSGSFQQDGQGNLHAVLLEEDENTNNGPTNVFYARSADGGSSWSALLSLSDLLDDTVDAAFPFVGADEDGEKIVACWNQGTQIFYAFSADGGDTFSAGQLLTDGISENQFCRVAVGSENDFYITYSTSTAPNEFNVVLRASGDGGQTFDTPLIVNGATTPETEEGFPMIAVDDLGRIDVVWVSDTAGDGNGDIVHARSLDGGVTFSPKTTLVDATGTATLALPNGLRHDSNGRLYLQYFAPFGLNSTEAQLLLSYGE